MALNLLVEGNSIRSTERITGIHRDTLCRLVVRFGGACREFLDERLRGLNLQHVQCDEIWTFVAKKQGRLTMDERESRGDIGDMYLWTAVDDQTKLVASFAIGKRSADMARRLMMDLASRINMPPAHASDAHAFRAERIDPIIQISTDGFAGYPEAVDLAFGRYALYGQLVKNYRNAEQPGRYAPGELVASDRRAVFGDFDDRTICTSHVERHNLTIRTFMRRFTRLSLGFSKKLENLAAAVAMFLSYYNFCWRPRYEDWSGRSGQRRPTPAMAAGVTERLWKFADLFEAVTP